MRINNLPSLSRYQILQEDATSGCSNIFAKLLCDKNSMSDNFDNFVNSHSGCEESISEVQSASSGGEMSSQTYAGSTNAASLAGLFDVGSCRR